MKKTQSDKPSKQNEQDGIKNLCTQGKLILGITCGGGMILFDKDSLKQLSKIVLAYPILASDFSATEANNQLMQANHDVKLVALAFTSKDAVVTPFDQMVQILQDKDNTDTMLHYLKERQRADP